MTTHQDTTAALQAAVAIADGIRFSAEDERCRAVREFYELRGLHRRGLAGDCALVTALRNATKAIGGRD